MKFVLLLAGWSAGEASFARGGGSRCDVRPAQACSTHFDVAGGGGESSEKLDSR